MVEDGEKAIEGGPVVGSAEAPHIFTDGYKGILTVDGVATFRFVRSILSDSSSEKSERRVVVNLAMGLPALIRVHAGMGAYLEQLRQDGIISEDQPAPDENGG
jgi:hypothetical protein